MKYSAAFELITPEKAKAYLALNKANYRKISSSLVAKYASDMTAGRWEVNGEPIQFDSDGFLVNGQHRLAAIVKANVNIMMLVVRGIESTVFDIGKTRSFVQIARANGRITSTSTGGAVDIIANGFTNKGSLSPTGVYEYYMNHDPDLFDASMKVTAHGKHGSQVAKKAAVIAAIYCALKLQVISTDEASKFCKVLNTGVAEPGEIGNAPQVLRRQIVAANNIPVYNSGNRLSRQNTFEETWKAINSYKNGELRKRDFKPDGSGMDVIERVRQING